MLVVAATLLLPAAPGIGMWAEGKLPGAEAGLAEEEGRTPIEPGPEVPGVTSSRYLDRDRNRIFDDLDQRMLRNPAQEVFDVIVVLSVEPTPEKMTELKRATGGFVVTSYKDEPSDPEGKPWTLVPAFAASLTRDQIKGLAARGDVMQLEDVRAVQVTMNTARDESGVDKAKTDFGVNGDRTGALKTYTKDDIVICIVDTGIEDSHADLNEGQVIAFKDFVGGQAGAYDDNGHGSHVAGTAAGQGDESTSYRGVAHGAALVGVKVLDAQGSGTIQDVIDGMNWCKDNKSTHGIEVMSLSLGAQGCSDGTESDSQAANNAVAAGLVVTIAAGNEGPGYCTIGSPGSAANVITVGAVSDPDNAACGGYLGRGWYLADFSSRGKTADGRMKPDIVAPGVCITSTDNDGAGYVSLSGTSMATPFVAGVAALMLDANTGLTPAKVKANISAKSRDWGPNNQNAEPQSYDYGSGVIDAHTAVEAVCGCGAYNAPGNPTHYHRAEDLGATGNYDRWKLNVTSTGRSVSVTLIIPSASGTKDFDLRLYRPDGTQVATSLGTTRQETISYVPTGTGIHKVRVESYAGSGSYWLDTSASANSLTLEVDQ